ncbi:MAG: hypothetical protein ACPGYV_13560 [Phycisphaeraceae bacterium]
MNGLTTMQGRVTDRLELLYRTPTQTVADRLPVGLEPVVRGPWSFWTVVCRRIERLRPVGMPAVCGLSFLSVSYRLRVQAMNDRAEVVAGDYTVRSDVDGRVISMLGSRLADRVMHPAAIASDATDSSMRITVDQTRCAVGTLDLVAANAPTYLSADSCFPSLDDARRFAIPIGRSLDVIDEPGDRRLRVTRTEGIARAQSVTPVMLHRDRIGFFDAIDQTRHVRLEWAHRLSPIDAIWRDETEARLLIQRACVDDSVAIAV